MKYLKPDELQIGNYIHHNLENADSEFLNNYLTVCELDDKHITTYYIDCTGEKQMVRGKNNYLPIPITQNWLKFLNLEDYYSRISEFINIEYVHELQNFIKIGSLK